MTAAGPRSCRRAATLLEGLFGLAIAALIAGALVQMFGAGRRMEDELSAHLALQADGRRALADLLGELQEGMIVVRPVPGETLPYAVVRDRLCRLVFYSTAAASKPGELALRRDLASPASTERKTLMEGVVRVAFTALSDSALQLHLVLGAGDPSGLTRRRLMAFHTEVRMRNRDAADGPREGP